MRLQKGFITHEIDGGQIMVGAGSAQFAGLVRSNRTAAFIVEQLKCDTTKEKIVAALLEKYDASKERVEQDVEKILTTLREIGALDE